MEVCQPAQRPQHHLLSQIVGRFVVESKVTARLSHPGIPPVYALGALADGRPYLAMKLIKGDTLQTRQFPRAEFVPTKTTGLALPMPAVGEWLYRRMGGRVGLARTWFWWSEMEVRRGVYDFSAYERLLFDVYGAPKYSTGPYVCAKCAAAWQQGAAHAQAASVSGSK